MTLEEQIKKELEEFHYQPNTLELRYKIKQMLLQKFGDCFDFEHTDPINNGNHLNIQMKKVYDNKYKLRQIIDA